MISWLILILSIPVGLLIAWFARDELIAGRKWFIVLSLLCVLDILVSAYLGVGYWAFASSFALVVSLLALWKSYNSKWTNTVRK